MAGDEDKSVFSQEVKISESDIDKIMDLPIRTHVRIRGIEKIHPRVISRDVEAIKRSQTIAEITNNMAEAKNRWVSMGFFNSVNFNLEPTYDGEANDVCVHIDVEEAKPKKSFGIFTTETVVPELTLSLENIFGGRYTLSGNYVPPTSRTHAASFSLISSAPFVGQVGEYYIGKRTENRVHHPATCERIEEIRATTKNIKRGFASEFSVGFQRRILVSKEKGHLNSDLLNDFSTTFKGYMRHELALSNVGYHADPFLANMYPLPIQGNQLSVKNELAGGPCGGQFTFFKSEIQAAKYWPLGPFCSLQWNTKLAGIWSYRQARIPLNDRLFLSNCHVRGFKSVGPSTLDNNQNEGGRFAATGGNALWASSISINFPFLLFPHNGLASMHLFANVGNLRMIQCQSELIDIGKWFRSCAASVGFGVVVTRIPLFGVAPSGRFELNFSLPVGIDRNWNVTWRNGNKNLFDHVKFGLTWSSAFSL
ncbi:putative Tob55 [Trypanosoma rangeli]|uniref:Putative Tob55 n=1 Tax=Trypanosoma rangeli TaxID=5698 RepID=A0A3R7L3S8_TRYRA|nr:putative Tob55 [Trypanosoma rangeli]RNF06990.1 putative Tob55 [Trypanosoma rangeli]|eukprot:RNF06990.1 putative Tob55 [Trypanosoma rangeli]